MKHATIDIGGRTLGITPMTKEEIEESHQITAVWAGKRTWDAEALEGLKKCASFVIAAILRAEPDQDPVWLAQEILKDGTGDEAFRAWLLLASISARGNRPVN